MIEKRESAFASLIALDGPMVAVCLISNVAILFISYTTPQNWAAFLLLATAFKLAFTPREKFIDNQAIWSPAMIRRERSLIIAAIVLYMVSCAVTLLVIWLTLPFARSDIPFKAAIAATAAIAAAVSGWLYAKNRWSQSDRISSNQGDDASG